VDGALGDPPPETDRWCRGDGPGGVVLDHDGASPVDELGQGAGSPWGGRDATGVLSGRLQDHGRCRRCQRSGQGLRLHAFAVERDTHDISPDGVEQVQQGREARVLDDDAVAEANGGADNEVQSVHRAVDNGEIACDIGPFAKQDVT